MQMQIKAEICQHWTAVKDRFFRKSKVAQIEKCPTNESYIITWGMCSYIGSSKWRSGYLCEFLRYQPRICLKTATSRNVTSFLLEDILGTQTKLKVKVEVTTVVTTSKIKQKRNYWSKATRENHSKETKHEYTRTRQNMSEWCRYTSPQA